MPDIKLGSLFDGIGVFPLAASRCGIRPVWASEIEKAPISITKRHFPDMVHLGDITKVDGGKIPPVHVITFGSPCQNLSLIGKPGDIIFFTGTYDSPGPVSHVGIYVGDGMMLHCGSPIQYANINSSYWQTHFYAFGRL